MTKARLPEGWYYTGKTFQRNLEECGVVRHFYWDPAYKSIYQVTSLRLHRGSPPISPQVDSLIDADLRYVNPENQRTIPVLFIKTQLPPPTSYQQIQIIFYDKEVKPS